MESGFGWVKDRPDARDHLYSPPVEVLRSLPEKVDLRPLCPPVYNQLQINSCTANAIGGALEFEAMKQGIKPRYPPSRLFIYYNERALEGTTSKDSGGQLRDGIKCVAKKGFCAETLWPYTKSRVLLKPDARAYARARRYKALEYQRMMHKIDELRSCLASGSPFVFGFKVFSSFQGAAIKRSGRLEMPRKGEKTIGLHAVLAVGYDDVAKRFVVRNSWGKGWGTGGYFTMPYDYLLNPQLSHDFWTIRLVS